MEKQIIKWSYWLGVACAAVAFIWRALSAMGVVRLAQAIPGVTIWYSSFMKAAVLLLLIAIATYCYSASQKS